MPKLSKLLILTTTLMLVFFKANATDAIRINPTNEPVLLDGRCANDEWQVATKIELPAQVAIYLMHDKDFFYICAKGKAEDITVLDLYIENSKTGELHNFHLSAQMGESVLTDEGWENKHGKWVLKDFAGFWVPYSGLKDRENRSGPIWAKGTHRQVQVARKKFSGNTWNMMFSVGAVNYKGNRMAEFSYPEKGIKEEKSSWREFLFSE